VAVLSRGALVLLLAGCEPEIGRGTYHCGPERLCPPDLVCDGVTAICTVEHEALAFECAEGSTDSEPDDDPDAPYDIGVVGCGEPRAMAGCLDDGADLDHLGLVVPAGCSELGAEVRYPVAFAPVVLEVIDDAGTVIASSEVCEELDEAGRAVACVTAAVSGDAGYVVRVTRGEGGDCDGACAYNRYDLSIF
jgi:hypothetical protein